MIPSARIVAPGQVWHEAGYPTGYTVLTLRQTRFPPNLSLRPENEGVKADYWVCLVTFSDGSVMVDPGLRLTMNLQSKHSACTRIA